MTNSLSVNIDLLARLRRVRDDRAVLFALLVRVWGMASGPVTLLIVARSFTPEVQGYYYTFGSLLALQTFVELSFFIVIINVASHEWASLSIDRDGRIVGDQRALSRLVSLGRLVFKWYSVISAVFVLGVGTAGVVFFSQRPTTIEWQLPWITLVVLTGLLLWTLPFNSLLEGCNQVATVNKFRLTQSMLGTMTLWITIWAGGGLWATVVSAGAALSRDLFLLLVQYRRFFEPFFKTAITARIRWRTEIWPMQWRLGMSGMVNYFAFSLFVPVMFQYQGPTVAGQMGMTWQVVVALQGLAMAWVSPRVPRFGMLIAHKDYRGLDRFWLRSSLTSLAVYCSGAGVVWLLVLALGIMQLPLAERVLAPLPTALFLLAAGIMQVSQCETAYLRAHRQEPIMPVSVTSGLAIGVMVWQLGSRFGPIGAASAYLGVLIPAIAWETVIWAHCRAEWHR